MLFAFVILVVVGILYRDKLKEFIDKRRARRGGRSSGRMGPSGRGPPPRFPPSYQRSPQMGSPLPRKVIPSSEPRPSRIHRPAPRKSPKELDEVLKKLKEIGK